MNQESTENIEKENINEENVSENQEINQPELSVDEQLQLDLEGTPAGMYFLTLEENGNISTKKFFVSK